MLSRFGRESSGDISTIGILIRDIFFNVLIPDNSLKEAIGIWLRLSSESFVQVDMKLSEFT